MAGDTARDLSALVGKLAALKGEAAHLLTDTEHAGLRLEAAHVATEAVASTRHSGALVCAEICRIGERMEPTPTSTQAERGRVYSAEYDEEGRYEIRRGNAVA